MRESGRWGNSRRGEGGGLRGRAFGVGCGVRVPQRRHENQNDAEFVENAMESYRKEKED